MRTPRIAEVLTDPDRRTSLGGARMAPKATGRQRFGPSPKPERDPKGRVVWTRREVGELGPVIRGAVAGSPQAVMR